MELKIRKAHPKDFDRLEEILTQNKMLDYKEVDGKQAMQRVYKKMGEYFLVAESNDFIVGMIRGCYDGSRAIIHKLAVDKNYQRQRIGKNLIHQLALKFKEDGAPSISATSNKDSETYYQSIDFKDLSINLMVALNIDSVINKTID